MSPTVWLRTGGIYICVQKVLGGAGGKFILWAWLLNDPHVIHVYTYVTHIYTTLHTSTHTYTYMHTFTLMVTHLDILQHTYMYAHVLTHVSIHLHTPAHTYKAHCGAPQCTPDANGCGRMRAGANGSAKTTGLIAVCITLCIVRCTLD